MLLLLIVEIKNMFGCFHWHDVQYQLSWKSPGSKIERIETLRGRYARQQWDLINFLPYIKEVMVTKNGMAAQWTQCSKECNLLWVNGVVRNALL